VRAAEEAKICGAAKSIDVAQEIDCPTITFLQKMLPIILGPRN
jgi:hypothetical protein